MNKPPGWRNESGRHSLAARGIPTTFRACGVKDAGESYNCFGRWGCIVKNPAAVISFGGDDYGELSLRDAITPEHLLSGVMYMNSVTMSNASEWIEKHSNDEIVVTNTENGHSGSITVGNLELCTLGDNDKGYAAWMRMIGDVR